MLHTLNLDGWEHTAWCVPSAVAMLTGALVGHMHVRAAFMQNKPRTKVDGMFLDEAVLLLHEQGYKATPIDLAARYSTAPTIRKFVAERTAFEFCMPIMFSTADHMMTCHMGFAGDNWTKRPVPVAQFPELNRKVIAAWVVSEKSK